MAATGLCSATYERGTSPSQAARDETGSFLPLTCHTESKPGAPRSIAPWDPMSTLPSLLLRLLGVGLCAYLWGGEWEMRSGEVKCLPHGTGLEGKLGLHPALFPPRFQVPPPPLGRSPVFPASPHLVTMC